MGGRAGPQAPSSATRSRAPRPGRGPGRGDAPGWGVPGRLDRTTAAGVAGGRRRASRAEAWICAHEIIENSAPRGAEVCLALTGGRGKFQKSARKETGQWLVPSQDGCSADAALRRRGPGRWAWPPGGRVRGGDCEGRCQVLGCLYLSKGSSPARGAGSAEQRVHPPDQVRTRERSSGEGGLRTRNRPEVRASGVPRAECLNASTRVQVLGPNLLAEIRAVCRTMRLGH